MPVYHLLPKIFFPVFHSQPFVLLHQMVLKHVNHGGNINAIKSVKFHQDYEMISFYLKEDLGTIFRTHPKCECLHVAASGGVQGTGQKQDLI